VDGM
jgi:hypothetical protein